VFDFRALESADFYRAIAQLQYTAPVYVAVGYTAAVYLAPTVTKWDLPSKAQKLRMSAAN